MHMLLAHRVCNKILGKNGVYLVLKKLIIMAIYLGRAGVGTLMILKSSI